MKLSWNFDSLIYIDDITMKDVFDMNLNIDYFIKYINYSIHDLKCIRIPEKFKYVNASFDDIVTYIINNFLNNANELKLIFHNLISNPHFSLQDIFKLIEYFKVKNYNLSSAVSLTADYVIRNQHLDWDADLLSSNPFIKKSPHYTTGININV